MSVIISSCRRGQEHNNNITETISIIKKRHETPAAVPSTGKFSVYNAAAPAQVALLQ